jgi:signal transduction histidine kinase/DNA-binding response OmpR family regulator
MKRLNDLAIRRKMTLIILLISTVGLMLEGIAIVSYEVRSYRLQMTRDLSTLAQIVGDQNTAVLAFDDPDTAQENLAALKGKSEIIMAGIYTPNNKLFARYNRADSKNVALPATSSLTKSRFQDNFLEISRPILNQNEVVGTVYIRSDLKRLNEQIMRYLAIVAVVIVGLMGVTLLLSTVLQKAISDPILDLARVAHSVTNDKDYAVRAVARGRDETGQLIDAFNQMLVQIQERDNALSSANAALKGEVSERLKAEQDLNVLNETLEQRVAARTQELRQANADLVGEITERKNAQAAAQAAKEAAEAAREVAETANHAKSEFLANMSHELRTPMNAIIGFSEILEDQTFGELNTRQTKYVGNILTSGRHLLQIINDVLDLAKIEAGRLEIEREQFVVNTAVNDVASIVQALANKKNISLEPQVQDDLPLLIADQAKFKQVLYNLLSNAIKFTPDGGHVRVLARLETTSRLEKDTINPTLHVEVSDNGIGVKPEDQKRIFAQFEQVDSSYSRQQQGTGLGLALTKRLIELHGGHVWIESEGIEGRGTTVGFELPFTADIAGNNAFTEPSAGLQTWNSVTAGSPNVNSENGRCQGSDAGEGAVPTVESGCGSRILIVEDNAQASDLLAHYLEEAGYEVAQAYNGLQALEMIRDEKPHAITLDVMLPQKSGWEVLERLKSDPHSRDIPVVMVSMTEDRQLGFSLGAEDFLIKPVDKNRLVEAIQRAGVKAAARRDTLRVLVADDDPQIVDLLADLLAPQGYTVLRAHNGQQAIDMAMEHAPDVLILDLLMPDISGFEVVHHLRSNAEGRNVSILIFTAKEVTSVEHCQFDDQVQAMISKSSRGDLLNELNKIRQHQLVA